MDLLIDFNGIKITGETYIDDEGKESVMITGAYLNVGDRKLDIIDSLEKDHVSYELAINKLENTHEYNKRSAKRSSQLSQV